MSEEVTKEGMEENSEKWWNSPKYTGNNDGGEEEPQLEEKNNSAEYTLKIIAYVILIIGLLAAVIMLFTFCIVDEDQWGTEKTFDWQRFAITIYIAISAVGTWAFLMVIRNISNTLKDISNSLADKQEVSA